jgi:CYTH domain-containing protein
MILTLQDKLCYCFIEIRNGKTYMKNVKKQTIPLEIERKFLIRCPDPEYISGLHDCGKTRIFQTYLSGSGGGSLVRIRKRGTEGSWAYTRTEKTDISDAVRTEHETVITEDEYMELLKKADPELKTIIKDRYVLDYLDQTIEIDVFPFWNDRAFMEIELMSEDQDILFPDFIHVIKEVTNDKRYTNRSLAREIPMEGI